MWRVRQLPPRHNLAIPRHNISHLEGARESTEAAYDELYARFKIFDYTLLLKPSYIPHT